MYLNLGGTVFSEIDAPLDFDERNTLRLSLEIIERRDKPPLKLYSMFIYMGASNVDMEYFFRDDGGFHHLGGYGSLSYDRESDTFFYGAKFSCCDRSVFYYRLIGDELVSLYSEDWW